MADIYFENTNTGKRYKVVSLDKDTNKVTLQGDHAQFTEHYDKEQFKRMGYKLVREEPTDAEQ